MNDEATTYYDDIITNMARGHKFLNELGGDVSTAWHIDPFGHSSAQADLFARMGFDAFMFARIDFRDKEQRREASELEFTWNPFGGDQSIFTHVFWDMYWGIQDYTDQYTWESVVDDPTMTTFNLEDKLKDFAEQVMEQALHFKTKNVFVPMGSDFAFQNAHQYFLFYDRLIDNMGTYYPNIKMHYSTPNEYIAAVQAEGVNFSNYTSDFFPYADD